MSPKPVEKVTPTKKVSKVKESTHTPFTIADIHYGDESCQAEMDAFLSSLPPDEVAVLQKLRKRMQSGACFKNGYRKSVKYVLAWLGQAGTPVTL